MRSTQDKNKLFGIVYLNLVQKSFHFNISAYLCYIFLKIPTQAHSIYLHRPPLTLQCGREQASEGIRALWGPPVQWLPSDCGQRNEALFLTEICLGCPQPPFSAREHHHRVKLFPTIIHCCLFIFDLCTLHGAVTFKNTLLKKKKPTTL